MHLKKKQSILIEICTFGKHCGPPRIWSKIQFYRKIKPGIQNMIEVKTIKKIIVHVK